MNVIKVKKCRICNLLDESQLLTSAKNASHCIKFLLIPKGLLYKNIFSIFPLNSALFPIQVIILVFHRSYIKEYIEHLNLKNYICLDFKNCGARCIFLSVSSKYIHRSRTVCTLVVKYPCVLQLRITSYGRQRTKKYKPRLFSCSDKLVPKGLETRKPIFINVTISSTLHHGFYYFLFPEPTEFYLFVNLGY